MKKTRPVVALLVVCLVLSSCSMNLFDFLLGTPKIEFDVDMDLGESTLKRMDDVNRTLAGGLEIGPQTRDLVRQLNATIGNGINLSEATLQRIDSLLRVLEDDLEMGLNEETRKTLEGIADTIDRQPDQWEDTLTKVIEQLEQSAGTLAGQMADEVKGLLDEALDDAQELVLTTSDQLKCNVEFLGAKIGQSLSAKELIGRGLNRRLRAILFPDRDEPPATPWVCQILPLSVALEPAGERLLAKEVSVKISGYNFTSENLPEVYLVDDPGNRVSAGPALFAHLTSAYLITLNLQDKDFQGVPVGSYIRLEWTDPAVTYDALIEAEEQVAYAQVVSEGARVYEGPGARYAYLGPAQQGARYTVLASNSDSSWWQIEYANRKGWIETSEVERNDVPVEVARDIPVEPPEAGFVYQATPESLVAPVTIEFIDTSMGEGLQWEWKFGEGEGGSTLQSPTHLYALSGSYQVRLTVSNDGGEDTSETTIAVRQPAPVAQFTADFGQGYVPLDVHFTSTSTGEPKTYTWDFGDGSYASGTDNPVHRFETAGSWQVTLTVANDAGTDSEIKIIEAWARAPVADFEASSIEPAFGSTVQFTDKSTNSPSSWVWEFGDGELSNEQHPRHRFTWAGSFEVKLTASNSGGSSTKVVAIRVTRADCADQWDTSWFSEEPTGEGRCGPDFVVKGIKCRGEYCDEMQLRCCRYTYDDPAPREWTRWWISEESGPPITTGWVAGLKCRGKYCDDLGVLVLTTPRLGGYSFVGTQRVSEESGDFVLCPPNSYVCGIGCDYDYCDNVLLQCCQASQ